MRVLFVTLLVGAVAPLAAQQDMADVQVVVIPVADGVHLLTGRGGNIGLSSGPDGVFLIDDQYAPLTEKITAAIRTVSQAPIRFVLNTHWHGDHTGGNEHFGAAGALLVAHDNVRQRMSVDQFMERFNRTVPASPVEALPVVTFSDAVTFYLNGDSLYVFHVPHAHTDGDAIIHFRSADVIHMGDTFFNGSYPFVDLGSGGSLQGVILAAEAGLALAGPTTRIIPGHGALGTRADLAAYRDLLVAARDRVQAAIAAGRTLEEVRAAKPLAEFDAAWGRGFVDPDAFLDMVYASLTP